MSCGVGHKYGSDSVLLWLWHRSAATPPIQPLAWGPPYAMGAALKRPKKKKRKPNRSSQYTANCGCCADRDKQTRIHT